MVPAFEPSSLLSTGPRAAHPFRKPFSIDLSGSFRRSHSFRDNQLRKSCKGIRYHVIWCKCATVKDSAYTNDATLTTEPHKYFDQVVITVRSGDGGHGAVLTMPKQKNPLKELEGSCDEVKSRKKSSYKRDFDGSLILPMGGHGGDVVIFADETKDSLLEFHRKSRYHARRGGNVDAMGVLTSQLHDGLAAPMLRIPVPVGTVVKCKKGKFLADLARLGDEILVVRGGQGGISLLEMPAHRRKRIMNFTSNMMRDDSDKVLVLGQPGKEVRLELILRVVADVGLVGLPNAGKSTLLAAVTHAKPDIADYPFTTLIPNLGSLDGDPNLGALKYASKVTLADLPGLIKGAHLGKGLGRNFLRHLRRTRLLVHVVDAAAENPLNDYMTVKEELRMYNPNYLERPYIVVLNKIDLPEAHDRWPSLAQEISSIGSNVIYSDSQHKTGVVQTLSLGTKCGLSIAEDSTNEEKEKLSEDYPRPLAVVGASFLKRIGIEEMLNEIRSALRKVQTLK